MQRKEAEEAIAARDAFNEAVLASLPGKVAILDRQGRIVAVNRAWKEVGPPHGLAALGRGDSYLAASRACAAEGGRACACAVELIHDILAGRRDNGVVEHACEHLEEQWFETHVQRLRRPEGGAVMAYVDITDRKRAEIEALRAFRALAHLNRVASMNELGTAVAHELNQPLTAILANAQASIRLLDRTPPDLDEVRAALEEIIADDKRAGEVNWRLRALIKKGEPRMDIEDLNMIVREATHVVANDAILRGVALALELATDPLHVRGDAVQLQQIALNLIVNAFDAVAARPEGERRVTVRTAARDKERVALAVQDTGPGVAPALLERLFEPFFTTKPEGLGMGLSICRSIAVAHGGALAAESRPGEGATFWLLLPAASARGAAPARGV